MTAGTSTVASVLGIGQTEFSRDSGRSEWELAIEAAQAACVDADLDPSDIDGLISFTYDNTDAAMLTRSFGITLRHVSQTPYGGNGATALIAQAKAVVEAGVAKHVLCFRSLNGRSGTRYGRAERTLAPAERIVATGDRAPGGAFAAPYGLLAPGQVMALWASRYAHEAGLSEDQLSDALGEIAVGQRRYANANPSAIFRDRPLSVADHHAGRMISRPLRMFDFAMESDGSVAVLVGRDRGVARDVKIIAASEALPPYGETIAIYGPLRNSALYRELARDLYRSAQCTPEDISVAMLYDATTISVLLQMEQYGFCEPGSAWRHVQEQGIGPTASTPINTQGGHLSEAYVHGLNHISEGVRQARHEASTQIEAVARVLVTSGAGGLIFGGIE